MASVREQYTKDGKRYFEIRCRRKGQSEVTTRWYPQEVWSDKYIERQLQKFVGEFETSVSSGKTVTRKERKQEEAILAAERAAEEAKIQTFRQYTERVYLPGLEVTAKKHTLASFRGNLRLHIYPHIGEMKLPEIGPAEIKALLLSEQKTLKIDSVMKLYCILKLVFKSAYLDGTLATNPMDKCQRPKAKPDEVIEETPESYTAEETNYIIECLTNEPFQWQCFVNLLIDTGCRRGEAVGLQWQDVNFEDCSVFFQRQRCYSPEYGSYEETLKNRKSRKIFVSQEIINMLKALKEQKYGKSKIIRIDEMKSTKTKPDERYVFTQIISQSKKKTIYSDEPLHPDSPTRYFRKLEKRYGIEHFHPHRLRHTQASLAITSGADIASVSQKLGHSSIDVTLRRYTHASDESQKRASDVFRAALRRAKKAEEKAVNETM